MAFVFQDLGRLEANLGGRRRMESLAKGSPRASNLQPLTRFSVQGLGFRVLWTV